MLVGWVQSQTSCTVRATCRISTRQYGVRMRGPLRRPRVCSSSLISSSRRTPGFLKNLDRPAGRVIRGSWVHPKEWAQTSRVMSRPGAAGVSISHTSPMPWSAAQTTLAASTIHRGRDSARSALLRRESERPQRVGHRPRDPLQGDRALDRRRHTLDGRGTLGAICNER